MKKFTLILGGARSGKSSYAVKLAKKFKKVAFVATAEARDKEMKERIELHKKSRPKHWTTIEQAKDVSLVLPKLKNPYQVILIDCLGFLVSNLLMEKLNDKKIETKIKRLLKAIQKTQLNVILVSNEVGTGIVPDNHLTRRFRDLVGTFNQMLAEAANEVIIMQAGIALKIKGD